MRIFWFLLCTKVTFEFVSYLFLIFQVSNVLSLVVKEPVRLHNKKKNVNITCKRVFIFQLKLHNRKKYLMLMGLNSQNNGSQL